MFSSIGLYGNIVVILISIAMLYFGADGLVRGGGHIAQRLGIRPFVIGLTIVAFGTSLPEFIVSLIANVWKDSASIAIGNIIGSNITNIGLVLGLSAIIFPVVVHFHSVLKQLLFLLIVGILFYALALDGNISRIEGFVMISLLIIYVYYLFRNPNEVELDNIDEDLSSPFKDAITVILGSIALSIGAWLFVESGVWIAEEFHISKLVIGLTIIALGTSLPELATSLMAAYKKEGEMSIGNIIGSNIFNILFIMGGVAFVKPLSVFETKIINGVELSIFPHIQYIVMLGFGLILIPFSIKNRIGRFYGTILVLGYVLFNIKIIFFS
jgi:cation:H+ antiporter